MIPLVVLAVVFIVPAMFPRPVRALLPRTAIQIVLFAATLAIVFGGK